MLTSVLFVALTQFGCPAGNVPSSATCTTAGDPVDLAYGNWLHEAEDLRLPQAAGDIVFSRHLSTSQNTWAYPRGQMEAMRGMPKPFGERTSLPAMNWWHNWLSFVEKQTSSGFALRQRGGRVTLWDGDCVGSNWIATSLNNTSENVQLGCISGGFVVVEEDGTRAFYEAAVRYPGVGTVPAIERWFLTRVVSAAGVPLATVSYDAPLDPKGSLLGCPQVQTPSWQGGNFTPGTWVPFIRSIESAEGASAIEFRYELATSQGEVTCPISELQHRSISKSVSYVRTPVVKYEYSSGGWGGQRQLWRVSIAANGVFETKSTYVYPTTQLPDFVVRAGPASTETHRVRISAKTDSVTRLQTPTDDKYISRAPTGVGIAVAVTDLVGMGGANQTATQSVVQSYVLASAPAYHGGRLDTLGLQSCPALGGTCALGTWFDWDWSSVGAFEWRVGVDGDQMRSLVAMSKAQGGATGAYPVTRQTGISQGVNLWPLGIQEPLATNCVGLECEWTEYQQAADHVVRVSRTWRRSSLDSTRLVETRRSYSSSGQLASVITQGTSGPTANRFVGYFLLTSRSTGGNCVAGSDGLGRVVELQGPCFVSDFSATSCSGTFPLAQIQYHPDQAPDPESRNRLARQDAFPAGCASAPITTQYVGYAKTGGPTKTIRPDGVVVNNTFDNLGRLTSSKIGSQSWSYGYTSQGKLSYTRRPGGDFLVNCYDNSVPGVPASCGVAREDAHVAWTAVAADATGSGWVSAIKYEYAPTGRVVSVSHFDTVGTNPRFVRATSYDLAGNATFMREGVAGAAGDVARFDVDGSRRALGRAYNGAPPFCLAGGADSSLCNYFEYDAANRLSRLTEVPIVGQIAQTLIEYDEAGNICEIGTGTSATGCSLAESQTGGYRFDDFGNLITVALPNTGDATTKDTYDMEYDAAGRVTKLTTPEMRVTGGYFVYVYDQLGRLAAVGQYEALPSPAFVSIYQFRYGSGYPALPAGCMVPAGMGARLSAVIHPLGVTYFSYDEGGRVVGENLVKTGATSCAGPSTNLWTQYTYTPNGGLEGVVHPSGRADRFVYGVGASASRIDSALTTVRDASGADVWQVVASNIKWEPSGRLRGYQAAMPDTGNSAWVTIRPFDSSGPDRIGSISVGTQPDDGDIFIQSYDYLADQLRGVGTWYLDAYNQQAAHLTYSHEFDGRLRLTKSTGGQSNGPLEAPNSGPFQVQNPTYDGRGNRTGLVVDGSRLIDYSHVGGTKPDQLVSQRLTTPADSHVRTDYEYDRNGRVSARTWASDSSGLPADRQTFGFRNGSSAIGDSAIRKATIKGGTYEYVYDHTQRRIMKISPWGGRDSFSYSAVERSELLSEISENRTDGRKVVDDYLWLGGRPIAVSRGSFSVNWSREPDSTLDCSKGGETSDIPCGLHHVVTDFQSKPVLTLDSSRRISGVGEYGPFGQANTRFLGGETAHPYQTYTTSVVSSWTQQSFGLSQLQRLNFDSFDTEPGYDNVVMYGAGGSQLAAFTGHHLGRWTTSWVPVVGDSSSVLFYSDSIDCGPTDPSCFQGPWSYSGVALRNVEYQRYQAGATPWFPPIRLPGQYRDEESGLHENWNRFYDSEGGYYLSPEPMLQEPDFVSSMAQNGYSTPTYAYALNNPNQYTDPTGLCPPGLQDTYDCCLLDHPGVPDACGGFRGPKPVELPEFDPKSLLKPVKQFVEDVCSVVAMAKGGKQNIDNEYVRAARREADPCAWLQQQYQQASGAERLKIKAAQKFLGCRHSSGGGP